MSLRLRLLAAFAYVLLLIIVAFEVPLALNLARRVKAEVKNDASSQAFVVAADASGRLDRPAELQRLARQAGADLGARVIVVNAEGVVRADSGRTGLGLFYGGRPEIRDALNGETAQGDDVVVCAELEADDAVGLLAARRQHDDRHLRGAAKLSADVEARAVRQHHVEEH
jgi:hypothetical protein